jgi:hypothetical protein
MSPAVEDKAVAITWTVLKVLLGFPLVVLLAGMAIGVLLHERSVVQAFVLLGASYLVWRELP